MTPEKKFVFTYKDIAKAKGVKLNTVYVATNTKVFNPENLRSLAKYILRWDEKARVLITENRTLRRKLENLESALDAVMF